MHIAEGVNARIYSKLMLTVSLSPKPICKIKFYAGYGWTVVSLSTVDGTKNGELIVLEDP